MANQNNGQGDDDIKKNEQNGSDNSNENGNAGTGDNGSAIDDSGSSNDNGAGAKSGADGEGGGSAAGSNEGNGEKMLSQSEVNKIAAKEKNQGRQAVYNELGIDPNDSKTIALIKALASANSAGDGGDGGSGSDELNEQLEQAKHDAFIAEAKAEAMMQGCQKQFVDDAVTLVTARLVDDPDSDMKTIFGELKTKYPVWFEESDEDKGGNAGKKGTGSSMKGASGSDGGKGETSLGARLAAKRKGATSKKGSYWN